MDQPPRRRGGRAGRQATARPDTAEAPTLRAPLLPSGAGSVLVIACGALAREVLAVKRQAGLGHVDLHCLPAILHNRPERIAPAVSNALDAATAYDRVFVAYGDCGTGGALAALCTARGVEMLPGAHCYAFFEGIEAFAARDDGAAFYLTDFLAAQFDAFVTQPLGLDRHPELRDAYFGNYRALVYLAQTDDPALDAKAEAAAATLGLAYERRRTGFGALGAAVAAL
ncbi:DUF1638 domain-containing protein [Jannaschia sp. Os4]|uniref:DUF1638 domain-containing protein n=1 Tax=Jannaschia sp. Os4 TaxID=2807617 RepID=UPI00193AD091|nr:DUF1638 domain-containing protein [Jannaschia sp. Os4]MBM2577044.1 DUF1638 domain-containing protein [Jannaschia sp. Os4]